MSEVTAADAGLASGFSNVTMQVGGATRNQAAALRAEPEAEAA
jgi:hypothetical protein